MTSYAPKKKKKKRVDPESQCVVCKRRIEVGTRFCSEHTPTVSAA